jgi:hypothetical protein
MADDKQTKLVDTVHLNGRKVSRDELLRQQEAAASQKGVDIREVSKDDFKMRLKG